MSRVPRIRFKGFEEDWEQRKLGECFTERIESMPNGELISVTINDGIKKFSELGRHDNSNDDKSKYKKVCVGDIAYNSMRMWQGASGYSPYEGIVSPAYTVLAANNGVNSRCIAHQFKLSKMIHTFKINSQGITSDNWNLKFPTLSDISIYISRSIDEQGKIASLLESLDHLITLHQRKLEKLKIIKKSMLENLFPQNGEKTPKIRFSGFNEDWEQRKLVEVAIFNPKSKLPSTFEYVDLESVIGTEMVSHSTETINTAPSRAQRLAKKGDIFYQTVRPYQKNNYLFEKDRGNYVFSTGYAQLRPFVNERFLFYLIQNGNFVNMVRYNCTGTSYPAINSSDLRRIDIYLSRNSTEQKCIGNTIKSLDHLITLHQSKLEKLQKIKKSMLESMFV